MPPVGDQTVKVAAPLPAELVAALPPAKVSLFGEIVISGIFGHKSHQILPLIYHK